MTIDEKTRQEIFLRHGKGESMNSIAKSLGVAAYTVRYHLRREHYRAMDRNRRRLDGAEEYTCHLCGLKGHNAIGCPRAEQASTRDSSENEKGSP